ncbi:metallophosphoesterase family protein [Flavobacterium sp. RHBU_24]|uniref:metallophosphoesterase family protein n=1 Tax=Flavobacterium sp. RHBU_24 TaxID=3391185 RepID=UPI003984B8AE
MSFKPDKKYAQPIIKLYQPDDSYKALPLPEPTGAYPYHLDAETITEVNPDRFSFHMVGDTGGVRNPAGQQRIAREMGKQITEGAPGEKPAFLYHLGDVVYHYGEAEQYDDQFFKPYSAYPAPIFAIAGNHDSDVNPANPNPYNSLAPFAAVFCDSESRGVAFSTSRLRKSMTQPNVYWTLQTPLANIIGLHSNVPKYGYIGADQRKWFVEELKWAAKERPGKMIIVTIHHAPYTADFNHGASVPMITFLEEAFAESGVRPDIIFSGHVHNYQRFEKTYPDGKVLPFIVNGAGGFDELHSLVMEGDPYYTIENPLLDNVKLQNYRDDKHGFLKITLTRKGNGMALTGEYYVMEDGVNVGDRFEYGV